MDKSDSTGGGRERSPVIAAASDRLIDYLGGFKTVSAMVAALIEEMSISVPVVLHLDHGKIRSAASKRLTPVLAQS